MNEINNQTNEQANQTIDSSLEASNIIYDDNELLEMYIGKNYNKIINKKFNFAGFFLTSIYMLYRKMIGYGILFMLLNMIITTLLPFLSIILFFVSGFMVNKLYISHAKKKINKIKEKNPNTPQGALLILCSKSGGTNLLYPIAGLLIQIILLVISLTIFLTFILSTIFKVKIDFDPISFIEEIKLEYYIIPKDDRIYDGSNPYNIDIKVDDIFTYEIPNEFTLYNKSNGFTYNYTNEEQGTLCSIDLRPPIGYSSSESMIKQRRDRDMPNAKLKKIKINEITWITFKDDFLNSTYIYGTKVKGQTWLLTYNIPKAENISICNTYKDQILNSIKVK